EITPFLFSPEPVLPVSSSDPAVSVKGYHHEGAYLLVAVNTENQPKEFSFTVDGLKYNGSVAVLFENRQIQIVEGKAEDIIDAYGSRVYMVRYKMLMSKGPGIHPKNIVKDPSFEDISGLGVPSFCYARSMKDRGATYFLDSRVSARGQHALRMTAPDYEGGNVLSFFPSRIEPGQTYTISIQARALPLKYREKVSKGFFGKICGCGADEEDHPVFSLGMGESGCEEYFITGSEWEEYSFSCLPGVTNGRNLISPILRMHGKGTAWFDLLQMYPDMELKSFVTRENTNLMVRLTTVHKGADIFYTIDGSEPTSGSTPFKGNFSLEHSATIKAAAFTEGKQMGYLERYLQVHHAIGRYVEYKNKYSSQYDAGYKDGLVDGILASSDFKDGKWQGFEGSDLDVTVHLREILPINRVILRFLVNPASWIFMPSYVSVLWSANGVDYYPLRDMEFGKEENANPGIHEIDIDGDGIQARYFRIMAKNIGVCPEGHPGAGGKAWLFTDEIIIE
ncbi:MAG TPA: chitobiase/beta-hexosaminidase C-terminal domain-containing protein, partial [Bacteroidales bacterium]|nr:chitobiase/beta-hexosaminidase C-terminal domain-containing protein [Bacteroidales bacterium]